MDVSLMMQMLLMSYMSDSLNGNKKDANNSGSMGLGGDFNAVLALAIASNGSGTGGSAYSGLTGVVPQAFASPYNGFTGFDYQAFAPYFGVPGVATKAVPQQNNPNTASTINRQTGSTSADYNQPTANSASAGINADLNDYINKVSAKYGVDASLVKAVIKAESGFNHLATSVAGAMGLMQLMPATAKSYGVNDPYNPYQNVDGGIRLLKDLMDRYNGNSKLALAAYNAGIGAVDRAGGVPDYRETIDFVRKVLDNRVDFTV